MPPPSRLCGPIYPHPNSFPVFGLEPRKGHVLLLFQDLP